MKNLRLKMSSLIKSDERVDDLQVNGAKIIQNSNLYTFANDPILLVNFANIKKNATVVDMCSGSGVIALLVALKSSAKKVYAIEVQTVMADMCSRSVELNGLQGKIQVVCDKAQNYSKYITKASVDVVFCNPPYFKKNSKKVCENQIKTIARHEVEITLKEVIMCASEMLNSKGTFYLVHQAERLQEICAYCSKNNLAIKELMLVQANKQAKPHLVLIKAVKDGVQEVQVLPNLILNKKDGTFTTEVKKMYSRKSLTKKE